MGPYYWHVFNNAETYTEDGLYAAVTIGEVKFGPDDQALTGQKVREAEYRFHDLAVLKYAASFLHEPKTEDLDELAPEGHRSYEQE